MNTLYRSIPYWILVVLSLAGIGVGGWLVWDNTSTMATTLLDGTATNIEVYVGQAWITAGAAVLAAGIVGILLALALGAVSSLRPASAPAVIERTGHGADEAPATDREDAPVDESEEIAEAADEDQNGSSGSTATATKISVK